MQITFIGADHEVTGSCHYLEAAGKKILVDYGMEQGPNTYENAPLPVPAAEIDYVFVTHAHIDHSGMLPLLGAKGFRGQIFATKATCDLCDIMLLDSAHIQEFEAEWRNRKGKRKGAEPYEPFYTVEDADRILSYFVECDYGKVISVCEGIQVRFNDVGHLLGSAAIELWATENEKTTKIVFSGDIGNKDQPLINDPGKIESADYVLVESTYGDRSHGARSDFKHELAEIIQRTFDRGGNVVVPSFAVGRTQEMLYFLRQIKDEHLVTGHDGFAVYVDSPLAVKATNIFNEHTSDCFDAEARELMQRGINPISFPGLELSITSDESKAINFQNEPKVILSASGMCEAGRIKHHLKHNLWRSDSTILFVGYQAEGTLGRSILDGVKKVTLFGEEIHVEAEICQLTGISGHADREGLLDWLSGFKEKPKMVFAVHGDYRIIDGYAQLIHETLGLDVIAPYSGTVYDLTNNEYIKKTDGVPFVKKDAQGNPITSSSKGKVSQPYQRLENTAERLMAIIHANRGLANKDLAKFADQLQSLCDKWER